MNKKVYNKRKLVSGITFLLLSILNIIATLSNIYNLNSLRVIKVITTTIICILFGLTEIYMSMNNKFISEDMKNCDERELLVRLKARSKSFSITFSIFLIIIAICLILLALTQNYFFGQILIGMSIAPIIMIITEIITYYYYNKHN